MAPRHDVNTKAVGLVQLKSATLGVFAVRPTGMYLTLLSKGEK